MRYGERIDRVTLALIFLCNAVGVVDQTRAAHELAAHGAPAALVPALIMAGRALQLVAGIALVIGWHERLAALFLALFLIPATLAAHDFWAYHGSELQGRLANFLKNVAMFGGLIFVSFRLGPGTPPSQKKDTFQADSVMRSTRNLSTSGAPGRSLPV